MSTLTRIPGTYVSSDDDSSSSQSFVDAQDSWDTTETSPPTSYSDARSDEASETSSAGDGSDSENHFILSTGLSSTQENSDYEINSILSMDTLRSMLSDSSYKNPSQTYLDKPIYLDLSNTGLSYPDLTTPLSISNEINSTINSADEQSHSGSQSREMSRVLCHPPTTSAISRFEPESTPASTFLISKLGDTSNDTGEHPHSESDSNEVSLVIYNSPIAEARSREGREKTDAFRTGTWLDGMTSAIGIGPTDLMLSLALKLTSWLEPSQVTDTQMVRERGDKSEGKASITRRSSFELESQRSDSLRIDNPVAFTMTEETGQLALYEGASAAETTVDSCISGMAGRFVISDEKSGPARRRRTKIVPRDPYLLGKMPMACEYNYSSEDEVTETGCDSSGLSGSTCVAEDSSVDECGQFTKQDDSKTASYLQADLSEFSASLKDTNRSDPSS
jgi:hypothetical protein